LEGAPRRQVKTRQVGVCVSMRAGVVRQGGADWGLTESRRRDRRMAGRHKGARRGPLSMSVTATSRAGRCATSPLVLKILSGSIAWNSACSGSITVNCRASLSGSRFVCTMDMYECVCGAAYSMVATTGCGTLPADSHSESTVCGTTSVPVRACTASVLSRQGPIACKRLQSCIAAKSGKLEQH
jgi:hypothetical protein